MWMRVITASIGMRMIGGRRWRVLGMWRERGRRGHLRVGHRFLVGR